MFTHCQRIGIGSICLLVASFVVGKTADAESFPSRPVKIINPAPAGNGPDVIGRLVAEHLGQAWRQQVLTINRPGAGGLLAAQAALAAERDGYTLYQTNSSSMIVLPVTQKLSFDFERDFVPVSLIGEEPFLIAVSPSLGAKSLSELIAMARQKRSGELLYAASGRGSMPHLVGDLFRVRAGVDLTFIPYPSNAQALAELLAGRISMVVHPLSSLSGAIEGGTVRLLATTSAQRLPNLPNIPTVAESIPTFAGFGWFALMAPAGVPEATVEKVSRDLRAVLGQPGLQKRVEELGTFVHPLSPAETATFIRSERALWTPVAKKLAR